MFCNSANKSPQQIGSLKTCKKQTQNTVWTFSAASNRNWRQNDLFCNSKEKKKNKPSMDCDLHSHIFWEIK